MTINQIVCFEALSRIRSIPKVAQIMHITPNGLRLSLHRMEEELGVKLIVWGSTKGFSLTKEGELFLESTRQICRIYDQALSDLTQGRENKPLLIASGLNFPSSPMGHLMSEYARREPWFHFSVTDLTNEQCDEAVLNDAAEIGINTGPFDARSFAYWPCFRYSLFAVVNRQSPLADYSVLPIEELGNYTLCISYLKPEDRSFWEMCSDAGISPHIGSRLLRDDGAIRSVVLNPDFIGITNSEAFSMKDYPEVKLLPIRDTRNGSDKNPFEKTVYIFHKKNAVLSRSAKAFLRFVFTHLRENGVKNIDEL